MSQSTMTDETPLHVVLEVPDHESLETVLGTFAEINTPVKTTQIAPADMTTELSVTIDLGMLTDKQREALEIAVDVGYYEQPREATLGDLADRLEITKSAVSQRLRAAETKLVQNALGSYQS